MIGLGVTVALVIVCLCIVLPIVAIVRTGRIRSLEQRIAGLEAALVRLLEQRAAIESPAPVTSTPESVPPVVAAPPVETPAPPPPVPVQPPPRPVATQRPAVNLETVIGQKWLGWVAIALIIAATAYFLKYAFENQWIGELGRVTLGVVAGVVSLWGGLDRYRKGWRYLSQVLTGGGIVILYLSVYGAFAYYHLVPQVAAFVFLVILVAEAHALAVVYNARAIAVMALAGGFLTPVLLSTGRDQYAVLFTYIVILDLGMLGIVVAKRWRWIGSLAYAGTQVLFIGWYDEHYHPEKRAAVLLFQTVVFTLFLLADLAPHLRKRTAGWEEWIRVAVNPFMFYGICYGLLNEDHHDWMAVLALAMGIVHAGLARVEMALQPSDRRMLLVTVGTALTFATLAIPVQLEANWITIAWAMEALALTWASFEADAPPLRLMSAAVYVLAIGRFLFNDTPWDHRAVFTPVFNQYFLGTLVLAACIGGAGYWFRRARAAYQMAIGLAAVGVLWLGSSVEAFTYFDAQANAMQASKVSGAAEAAKQLRWASQLALSVLWSVFAGLMTAAGFRFRQGAWRVAGLVLFGLTLLKVVFSDMAELQQFYRILALLALGVILLGVAWAYQRVVRREQAR